MPYCTPSSVTLFIVIAIMIFPSYVISLKSCEDYVGENLSLTDLLFIHLLRFIVLYFNPLARLLKILHLGFAGSLSFFSYLVLAIVSRVFSYFTFSYLGMILFVFLIYCMASGYLAEQLLVHSLALSGWMTSRMTDLYPLFSNISQSS